MHGRYPFYPQSRSDSAPRTTPRTARVRSPREPREPHSARERLLHAHRLRTRVLRELGVQIPAAVLDRHPRNLSWQVSVMDRWIARHLDLAGGRHLPAWDDEEDEGHAEREEDDDLDGDVRVRSGR